jgi:GT2 family glycosyltransferase
MTSPTPATRPHAVLVVGMHRSGTSATASALGELGLRLPRPDDLLGARLGNERGHFESRSLMALSDELLARLGRAWDDPPELGEVDEELTRLVAELGERSRAVFEAAFDAPADPVVWKDPRTALLLPFWRAVLERPIVAVLVTRDPLAAARSLARRNALELTTGLALWERYFLHALAGLEGLPVFVSELQDAITRPEQWRHEVGEWLAEHGLVVPARSGPLPFDEQLRHEAPAERTDTAVLAEQRSLFQTLCEMRGGHRSFVPPARGGREDPCGVVRESIWTTSELRRRHDLNRLWRAFEWTGTELARIPLPGREPGEPGPGSYPMDATDDEGRYHTWLRKRGEAVHVGSGPGVATPATRPPAGTTARPRFSVVVPAYRTPLWAIDRCVGSVLAQRFASYDVVVVDDASGDAVLADRLRELSQLDSRLKVVTRATNGGIAAATNDGIAAAAGEWIVFLDHDDELSPHALEELARALAAEPAARLAYSDEDKIDEEGRRFAPAFKPDWSPDLLLSNAYMCHLLAVRRDLLEEVGPLRSECDGAQDYDLMLRATERLRDDEILHVPKVLYHWRTLAGSASGDPSAKPWALEAGRRALEDAVRRRGLEADVDHHPQIPGSYFVRRRVSGRPLVSAVIPFRDEPALLAACYRAFVTDPGLEDFELLLVDNDSVLPETRAVVERLAEDDRVRLIEAPGPFNWVRINNDAAAKARGDLLLFLNNDVEARSSAWLAHMVAQAQRDDVGAVGARLLFPDGSIQHGGVAVGVCWGAAHIQQGLDGGRPGYLSSVSLVRNTSAVTGACLMSRREVFEAVEGFDESLPVAFNDIDYCLRLRERGLLVVYTPLAELVHHESKSRGHTDDVTELPYFRSRWRELLIKGDPYYNPNLGRFDSFCRLPNEEDEARWQSFLSMLGTSSTS